MAQKKKGTYSVPIAVIGGSGLYDVDGVRKIDAVTIKTPFGDPSDSITIGEIGGVLCAFLPRHGRGHRIMPSEVNSRANIYALKSLGVEQIISISACGSLKEELRPRDFVLPDQLFDRTKNRPNTFFGDGIVAHVGFAEPFCGSMRSLLHKEIKKLNIPCHEGGTYVCIEGPQFSTKAESQVNRAHGFSVIGMTAIPEAKLAREAEICYATVALVTDYDVWKEGEEVTIETLIGHLNANVANAKRLITAIVPRLAERKRSCGCKDALACAIMTQVDAKNKKTYQKLKLFMGKYVK